MWNKKRSNLLLWLIGCRLFVICVAPVRFCTSRILSVFVHFLYTSRHHWYLPRRPEVYKMLHDSNALVPVRGAEVRERLCCWSPPSWSVACVVTATGWWGFILQTCWVVWSTNDNIGPLVSMTPSLSPPDTAFGFAARSEVEMTKLTVLAGKHLRHKASVTPAPRRQPTSCSSLLRRLSADGPAGYE